MKKELSRTNPAPPRLARFALLGLLPLDRREYIAGDLEEGYRRRVAVCGNAQAGRWYWSQTVRTLVHLLPRGRGVPETLPSGEQPMQKLWQDLKYGVRACRRNPGFTLATILTLALGIGANTAMFSFVNAFLFKPLPVDEPTRLVSLYRFDGKVNEYKQNFSYPVVRDLQRKSAALDGVFARTLERVGFGSEGRTDMLYGEVVTGNYFDVLGVRPALGRGFLPEEYQASGSASVIVIGHQVWEDRFGGDPAVVGSHVRVNNREFTIVGVAPPEFLGTKFGLAMDYWMPVESIDVIHGDDSALRDRESHWLEVFGRLKPGLSMGQAEADLASVMTSLREEYPEDEKNISLKLGPARGIALDVDPSIAKKVSLGGAVALAVVAIVLLIACANVANLMLIRASGRRKEVAMRLALGAPRTRLVRQLLTESMTLSLAGGAVGLLFAFGAGRMLNLFLPQVVYTIRLDVSPDANVLLFTLAATVATGVLFGLAPALQASRLNLVTALRGVAADVSTGRRGVSLQKALVVSQIALSLILLAVAGLFLRSVVNAQTADPGFLTKNLLFTSLDLGLAGLSREEGERLFDRLETELPNLPAVRSAALCTNLPLDDSSNGTTIWSDEGTVSEDDGVPVEYIAISGGFFEAMGIPLQEGRTFAASDDRQSPGVAMVNRALADRMWKGRDPVGRRIHFRGPTGPTVEVVGVVGNVKQQSLGEDDTPSLFRPLSQSYSASASLVVQTEGDPAAAADPVRRAIRDLNPNIPLFNLKTINQHMSYTLWHTRLGAALATLFGFLALALATVGLYGVISYGVARRTREIGIRMALGARRRDVITSVLRGGLSLVAIGGGLGLAASLGLSRLLASILFGVSGIDYAALGGVFLILSLVSLLACYLPARKASKLDPIATLRAD